MGHCMSDSNVVGIGLRQNPELIQALERLLEEAKEGRLTTLTAFVMRDGELDYELDYGELTTLEMLGGLEMLKGVIMMPLLYGDEE